MQAEKTILQVARLSGLAHDLGKASKHFQHKLAQAAKHGTITKDETRHEWISTKLYQALRQSSYDWEKAWSMMAMDLSRLKLPFQVDLHNYGLRNLIDVVDFAVLTHHGLLGPSERKNYGVTPDASKHTKRPRGEGRKDVWKSAGTLPEELLEDLAHGTSQLELNTSYGDDHYCWQGIVVIARASLILADHEVSAQNVIKPKKNGRLYANTNQDHLGKAKLNQPLEWHLSQVSQRSVEIVSYFFHPQLPGISLESRQAILKSSENSRFQWQDDAVDHLRQFTSECDQQPTLVVNMAGTGSGKTLMNVKALAALRTSQEPLRIASGFNLRTLTLQTHSALKQMLSLEEDEISCVIGDRLSKTMHEQQIDEEEVEEVEIETFGKIRSLPTWLEGFIQGKPALRELVGSPVLVSTMDYLVKAGEPGTQAHHGHALLRIASSDLILDEVDSYDPNSLVAVLRVVQMSALFGRNVIASSATLSQPIAKALVKAYASGIRIRGSMEQTSLAFRLSLIDDVLPPESVALVPEQTEGWLDSFQSRQNQLVQKIAQRPVYRKPVILDVNPPPENDPSKETAFQTMWRCIEPSIPHFHKLHAWKFNEQKRVSVGLIRVAQVSTCIKLAQALTTLPNVHVTAYHAADFRLRRLRKEQALDRLLTRKGASPNQNLLEDEDIQRRVSSTDGQDTIFVVVATPLEEVGRDHDFDWAIVEPSSSESIVQLAGRVNRHRLDPVTMPNVGILRFNLRALAKESRVFLRPGNEVDELNSPYPTHDLGQLLGTREIIKGFPGWIACEADRVDASLRFGFGENKCLLAHYDDLSISTRLVEPISILGREEGCELAWATECHYRMYPLRKSQPKHTYRLKKDHREQFGLKLWGGSGWISPPIGSIELKEEPEHPQLWLCPSLSEIWEETQSLAEDLQEAALTLEISNDQSVQVFTLGALY